MDLRNRSIDRGVWCKGISPFPANLPAAPPLLNQQGAGSAGKSSWFLRWAIALLAVSLCFAGSGCRTSLRQWVRNGFKVGPNYARPDAKVSDQWIDSSSPELKVEPTASQGRQGTGQTPVNVAWWAVFNDPTLTRLIEMASAENLPLQIAAERVVEARAQLGVARGTLWPQMQEMKGTFQRNQFSAEAFPWGRFPIRRRFDHWSVGFEAAWELDFWGRFRRAIEAAEANLEAQEAGYDEVLVILQAEVATNYIQLRTFDERLALARQNLDLQRQTLDIVKARFEAGLVSGLDLRQAEAIVATTRSLIPLLELGRRRAENRLCTLLGMPPQDLDPLVGTGKIPDPPAEVVVGLPADLLRQRPDVRKMERLVAAQSARVGIAEADLYPHFAITGTLNWEAEKFGHLFLGDAIAGRVGPAFSWKILNYGRIWNSIWAEDSRLRQAILAYQETVLRAAEEAEGTIAAYLREKERAAALADSVRATEQAVQLATALYQQGVIDYQRLIDSQRVLLQQQDALAESRGNVALYLVALYKALGGGWQVRLRPGEVVTPAIVAGEAKRSQTIAASRPVGTSPARDLQGDKVLPVSVQAPKGPRDEATAGDEVPVLLLEPQSGS
ncbi:MAG: efflux transporter outer membrane subunit [Thermoguttaceae bacterium]|nr:efflux transporter outer membrane subunit [Thermoguttaceae bacterium]MDW8078332.1 efflux transporter outer membrane subunit [Thermoguttaceae bacterium]